MLEVNSGEIETTELMNSHYQF